MDVRTLEAEGAVGSEYSECSSSYRRNTRMPRGGKLLTPEESRRLAVIYSVEREQLIAHIVEQLRMEERRRDRRVRRKRKGYGE